MRKLNLPILLAAVACCLILSWEVQAQPRTQTLTDITFDDGTGILHAYSRTEPDYSTQYYYRQVWVGNNIREMSTGTSLVQSGTVTAVNGPAEARSQVEANADEEYQAEAGHYMAAAYYVYNYYYNGQYMSGYRDPFDYGRYEGQGISAYFSYSFYGYGPEVVRYSGNWFLGQTKKKVKVGAPHHLKLISDTFPSTSCGSVRRLLQFRVVDVNGRGVGKSRTVETFEDINNPANRFSSIFNSCQNNNYSPAACSVDAGAVFTDQLWVGCPSSGGDCGFPTVASRWWSCPPGKPMVSLSTNVYEVRHNRVLVNGQATSYSPGTEFY
jgi:hypothetical protein